MSGIQETFEALGHFLYREWLLVLKEYRTNEELIEYLSSKGVIITNKKEALQKDTKGNYIAKVTFDEIYTLFEFDKRLKNIMLKYCLEIETVIKSIMANQISKVYGIKEYLNISNWDSSINNERYLENFWSSKSFRGLELIWKL